MSQRINEIKVYNEALKLSSEHYENFPVASFLFPKDMRKDVALIYRFARVADDIVDEGNNSSEERRETLIQFREDFKSSLNGNYENTFWELLHNTIKTRELDSQNFLNLLIAFEQDTIKKEYDTFNDLLGYCKNSADPVGRIILQLYGIKDSKIIELSDKICTALQLTNFWQDVSIDLKKDRIYIPLEDFKNFGVEKTILLNEQTSPELRQIISLEVEKTRKLFAEGSRILKYLPGRLKWQIKWTLNGGIKILEKLEKNSYDVLRYKPTLTKFDYIISLIKPVTVNGK